MPKELRLHLWDRTTNQQFLIDSGSVISIIPVSSLKNKPEKETLVLYAANSTKIETYGTKIIQLDLNLRRNFQWTFIIANIESSIIGADFLTHFNLLLDLKNKCLIDPLTNLTTKGQTIATLTYNISTINNNINNPYNLLLKKYINVTKPVSAPNFNNMQYAHRIITTGPPATARARKLAGEKAVAAKSQIHEMLNQGTIRPSSSAYASPIHLEKKQNNEWRLCGDYRQLNSTTESDMYTPPLIQDLFPLLSGTRIYTKLDLRKAYNQVPMQPEDIHKTAIITPWGLYEYLVMPYGLKNATQTFQRFMNANFQDFDFVFIYIDDILISSPDEATHITHVEKVLQRLTKLNLTINTEKCLFGKADIEFLGYFINASGYKPKQDKVKAILEYKKPETIEELRRFLGITNYYRKCIPQIAHTQLPLNSYLKQSKKKDKTKITWTIEAEQAFIECKNKIANSALLAFPSPSAKMTLTTDASSTAIGAKLEQLIEDTWQPIGFFSRKLSPTEQRYATYDRELLAIFASIKFFQYLLECCNFEIKTDHKPLIYAFKQKHNKSSERQLRQLDFISQFSTNISHVKGEENIVADALSRINTIEMPTIFTPEIISKEQRNDEELKIIIKETTSLKLQQIEIKPKIKIYCDISSGQVRPYIPTTLRKTAFRIIHNSAHSSGRNTSKKLREKYIWPGIKKDALQWSRECIECQKSKVYRHNKTEAAHISIPNNRFDHIHIDIIFLPERSGYKYCLTIIDRFTRWPVAVPIKDMSADTVSTALFTHWISHYGTPITITTDQGTQFESELFKALTKLVGSNKTRTTPYHPQSNGIVERMHRTLKAALMCSPKPWFEILPTILLGLRTSYKEDIKATPAEMLYGACLRIPGEFFVCMDSPDTSEYFVEKHREYMRGIRPTPTAHHSKSRIFLLKDMHTCTHVWLRCDHAKAPLEPPYQGPYKIIKRTTDKIYKILINGEEKNISIDRLKPCFTSKTDNNHNINDTSIQTEIPAHQWGSNMDKPTKTYERIVTFKNPIESHSRGSTVAV